MKRTVAIILAAVMMLGIIPASFMSVFAHGTGVGMNNIGNLSIDNTVGEKIAATVNVDGKYNDTAWKYEDWNIVTAQTGLWSVTLPKNGSFGYKYQLHTDYQYIYGVFVIDTNAVYSGSLGDITVWINTGSGDRYTDKIVLTADGTCTVYGMYEETADKGAGKITKTLCAKNTENGVLTIEFRTLVSNVTESVGSVMQSYVSVELGGETLWYPRFQAEGDTDINPAASWPKNSVEISKWDITAANHAGGWGVQNADFSNIAPSEIHVDGELNEGIWESFTDYFITSGDGFDYRNNSTPKDEAGYNFTNLSVGYSNSMYYWASESSASHKSYEQSPLRFKYDLRATEKYLYGAVLAYIDTNSTEFYNELKTADKSKTHVVPMWFNILFNAGTRSGNEEQFHVLRVKYNTEVKYDYDKGAWLPTFNYGDGKSETDFARVYAGAGGYVTIDGGNDWSKYAQATRLSRYLIGLEFKLPLAALGILDESTGLYRNSVTNKFDKTEFTFNNVVCASNVENMYHKYPQHLYGSSTAAYNAGSYAWHAWSVGSGLNVSRPVVASKNSQFTDPGIFTIDGHISTEYFANLNAADTIINSMGRGSGFAGKNDDVTDGVVGTYYHELTMDSDYLYGAAIIIDGDGKWNHKTASSGNNHDVFRIWLKNQGRTYGEPYDYVINFYISDVVNTDYGSLAVADIYKRDISHEIAHPIATSVSLSQKSGINTAAGEGLSHAYYSDTAANLAGHGIEVEMRTVNHQYRLISGSVNDTVKAASAEMCVLEFKIPLDLIGVEPQTATDKQYEAFSYATSVEVLGKGGASGLCWPLLDNSNISGTEPIDKMNLSKWNCNPTDTAYVYYTDKVASTIVIDGVSDEEIWNNDDERINVSTTTGTWQNIPTGKEYFDYQYKVYTGRNYLYGMAEINAVDSSFQLYVNANNGSKATHKYEFRIENGVGVCYETAVGSGAPAKVSFTKVISHKCQAHSTSFTAIDGGVEMHSVNGKTYLEFMIPLSRFATVNANTYTVSSKTFTAKTYGAYKYAVSATNNGKTLFHPDNSDVEGKTHSLWLTHYNADLPGGGSIINTLHAAQNTSTYYRAQFYFVPTQWEGIYKLDHYVESTSSQESVAVKIAELYPNGMPEGGFVYMSGSGNTTNNVDKLGITIFGLGYNSVSVSEMIDALSTKEGSYVRFTGVDLETYRINTIYDDNWRHQNNFGIPYYKYGYASDATYTIVKGSAARVSSYYPSDYGWDYINADVITAMPTYVPESITIDGDLYDYGWDDNKWIDVYEGVNGNIQNSLYLDCDNFGHYKYQIRTDGEYVYVAAVMDTPASIQTVNGVKATPVFRIWIQSQNQKYSEANSFTHYFDVRAGQVSFNILTDKVNEEIKEYNDHYVPKQNGASYVGANGATVNVSGNNNHSINNGGTISFDREIAFKENKGGYIKPQGGLNGTVFGTTYGESVFYGSTVFDAENLKTAIGQETMWGGWYAHIDVEQIIFGNESASFKENSDGNMQVEFKFALADIGCDDGSGFEYYVEGRSQNMESDSDSYNLFYPPVTIEAGNFDGDHARSYYFPFWVWGNTALTFNMEEAMLCNPLEPVSAMGAKYQDGYFDANTHGLKFGVLYTHKYLDEVYGRTDWTGAEDIYKGASYWDVKDIGMLVGVTDYLSLDGNNVSLKTDSKYTTRVDADSIEKHAAGSNMADYSAFVFYVVSKIPEARMDDNLTFRGFTEYYPYDDIYYDRTDVTDGLSPDGKDGYSYRPTYYGDAITRNYNLVKKISTGEFGDPEDPEVVPDPSPVGFEITVNKTLTNAGGEIYQAGASGFQFVLKDLANGQTVAQATSDVNGQAFIGSNLRFTKDDINKTYNYTITEVNDGVEGMTYDESVHSVTVSIGYNPRNNTLVPTVKINGIAKTEPSVTFGNQYKFTKDNGTKVVYIPLDNRPVNIDRAQYLAQASGIELIVPPVEYYSTTLDNDADNTTNISDQGNPVDLLNWLKTDPDVKQANNFVLSLDMLFSGGLVGSRDPFYDSAYRGNQDSVASLGANNKLLANGQYVLSETEKEIANYIIELAGEKNVFLFDTVMRLATTGDYGASRLDTYNAFRNAYADAERPILSGNKLTIDNIVANYDTFIDDTTLTTSGNNVIVNGSVTIEAEYKQLYNLARERKLRLVDYLVKNKDLDGDGNADIDYDVLDKLIGMYIGVDDSKDNNNIQLNERNYITEVLFKDTNALLFEGADELGLISLSDCVTNLHGDVSVRLEYFGSGKDWTADAYGYGSLSTCIDKHITAAGAHKVNSGADMDILVLTRQASGLASGSSATDVANLVNKLKTNIYYGVPTCVIDGSGYDGYGKLADAILAISNNYGIANLLGFSAWNTTGNATGIALANAVARCSYLANVDDITTDSHYGFLKSITYSYIKDDAYKKAGGSKCMASPSYFYNEADPWVAGINNSNIITKIVNGSGTTAVVGDVRVSNLKFPWNRSFEADFDIQIVQDTAVKNLLTTLSHSTAQGKEYFNSFTAGNSWWWGHESGTGDTTDTNDFPWANWYAGGDKLADGLTYNELGSNSTAAQRASRWYGMAYRGQVTNDSTPETNAGEDGICRIPSIKFSNAQNIDQIKMHFLYYDGGAVYLPESITVKLYDANGKKIGEETVSDLRKAEGVVVGTNTNKHESFWINLTLNKVYNNVSVVTIRPTIPKRNHATYNNLRGWSMMDEIEIYNNGSVIDNDGSAN